MLHRFCAAVLLSGMLCPCLATSDLIVAAGLGSASAGLIEARMVGPTLGIGLADEGSGCGAVLMCRSLEMWLTPFPGDYMVRGSVFSPFLYLTKGLKAGKRLGTPVAYVYAGGNGWNEDVLYTQAGIGLKWTAYVVSAAVEGGVMVQRGFGDTVFWPQLKLTVELGGWWPLRIR